MQGFTEFLRASHSFTNERREFCMPRCWILDLVMGKPKFNDLEWQANTFGNVQSDHIVPDKWNLDKQSWKRTHIYHPTTHSEQDGKGGKIISKAHCQRIKQ
ncbi:hypothetical protein GOODEAATRI_032493 [Goodea atripinnis]|uniref:HNH endonuclease n=1 Tax=Goodea atripinnis TaxID=208336 RepID=A0ABV0MX05_9TELE